AEVAPRRAQRSICICIRGREGEAADRSDGGRAVSALVGWRALGRQWQRRLLRRLACGRCDLGRRIERERRSGLLLRERWPLGLRIRQDFSRRRRLEPIALERNQAIPTPGDPLVAPAAAGGPRTGAGAREKSVFAPGPLP